MCLLYVYIFGIVANLSQVSLSSQKLDVGIPLMKIPWSECDILDSEISQKRFFLNIFHHFPDTNEFTHGLG